jgi:secondary thiamine-phosphate synthase enzyme
LIYPKSEGEIVKRLKVKTKKAREIVDITEEAQDLITKSKTKAGLCVLFVLHTTAALTTADLDPGTDLDMLDAFDAIVPKLDYRHPHDPEHVPEHILSTIIGASVTVPFEDGKLVLGTWQRIVLVEMSGSRTREIIVNIVPET